MKRSCDVLGAVAGLLILAPLLAAIGIAIRLSMGRPVLYCCQRPGLHGTPFTMFKFRTMAEAVDAQGNALSETARVATDSSRLTRLGRFLRRTSLDELPELLNVLRGDMSFVGPRPLLMSYLDRYTPEQSRRHDVLPGLTGWAQVHGRQGIPLSKRVEFDLWYVDNWSLWLDVRILFKTVQCVLVGTATEPGPNVQELDDLPLPGQNG